MEDEPLLKPNGGRSWLICFACALLIICTMGTCTNAFAVYLPFIEGRGLDAAAGSLILSIRCLFSLLGMVLVPLYYRFFSYRSGMVLACLMAAAAFGVYAIAASAFTYYVAAALAGLGYGLGSLIPVSVILNRWFLTNRGFALGICTAGTGVSTICFPPLITFSAKTLGLSFTFLLEGAFILAAALFIFAILRDTPAAAGREPFQKGAVAAVKENANTYNLSGGQWPLILSAILLLGGVSTAAPGHFSVLFTSEGYSLYTASVAVSIFGVLLIIGKLAYGKIADRWGGFRPSLGFLALLALGCACCCLGHGNSVVPVFLATVLMGVGFPLATVGLSVLSADLADEKHFLTTLKWFQIAYAAGGMLFSSLPGILFERLGTYTVSYQIFLGMTLLVIAAVTSVYRHRRRTLQPHPAPRVSHAYAWYGWTYAFGRNK